MTCKSKDHLIKRGLHTQQGKEEEAFWTALSSVEAGPTKATKESDQGASPTLTAATILIVGPEKPAETT